MTTVPVSEVEALLEGVHVPGGRAARVELGSGTKPVCTAWSCFAPSAVYGA